MLRGGSVKRFAKIISLLLVSILVMGSTYVTGYAYGTGDYVIYNVVSKVKQELLKVQGANLRPANCCQQILKNIF